MKVSEISSIIEEMFPPALAQDWDNVGLLLGEANKNVKKLLLTIDITNAVVAEAKRLKVDLIVSYHPVIWDGLKQVTAAGQGSLVYELIRSGISVHSIHTALDVVKGGINDGLAEIIGIRDGQPIGDFVAQPDGDNFKLVVFVPLEAVNKVSQAIFAAGAGAIGNYSHCSFRSEGKGTFLPLSGSRPTIGRKGKLEEVAETRLEAVVPAGKITQVATAMRGAHPYETPAFDVIKLYDVESRFGLGRMGKVIPPRRLAEIIKAIKKSTGTKAVGIVGKQARMVRTAAVCAGSCGKIINQVIAAGCDLYVTGELKHHHALAAQEAGVTCLCLSHTVSERFILKKLSKQLQKKLKDVKITISRKDADPFVWKQI
jgi:dinuclear metal center YbgI/SA1388 family protein